MDTTKVRTGQSYGALTDEAIAPDVLISDD